MAIRVISRQLGRLVSAAMPGLARGVALVAPVVLGPGHVGLAADAPRAVRGVQVSERAGTTVIDVRMDGPFRYLMHSPASRGTVLRIRLRPEGGASERAQLQGKQVVEWRYRSVVPLVDVEYDEEAADGPLLILRFEKRIAFSVSQGRDLESIRVMLLAEGARERAPQPGSRAGGRTDEIKSKVRKAMVQAEGGYARRGFYLGVLPVRSFEAFQDEIEDLVPGVDVSVDDSCR